MQFVAETFWTNFLAIINWERGLSKSEEVKNTWLSRDMYVMIVIMKANFYSFVVRTLIIAQITEVITPQPFYVITQEEVVQRRRGLTSHADL